MCFFEIFKVLKPKQLHKLVKQEQDEKHYKRED